MRGERGGVKTEAELEGGGRSHKTRCAGGIQKLEKGRGHILSKEHSVQPLDFSS